MVTWRFVQAEIASFTRVCAYDRAGLGFSDVGQRPSDVANMADDLSRLIAAADVAKPFVLVGHSLGGATAVLYAATHPDDLAGVVLVEPAFAGDLHALQAELPVGKRTAIAEAMERSLSYKRSCLALAEAGKLAQPANEAERDCVDESYDPNRLDALLREAGSRLLALPKVWQAMISEMASFVTESDAPDADTAELDAVTFSFGDKPLIVLSRGVEEGGPGVPPDALPRVEAAWRAGHAALATRSTRRRARRCPGFAPLRADRRAASRDRRGAEGGDSCAGPVRGAMPVQAGGSTSNGSSAATPSGAKWRMLRDRIVSPRRFAVAAMMTSANPGA